MDVLIELLASKPLLALGLVVGLILRTIVPWLMKGADRGRFDPKYHWDWILSAAVPYVPILWLMVSTGNVWGDLCIGAAVAFGIQSAVREFVMKRLQKPAVA